MLDLDEFKLFNDVFGHVEGDTVLKEVASVLCTEARETDFVARYGGEEFAVNLMETDSQGACEAAERFRSAIEGRPWPHRKVTASFGVATMTPWPHIPQELIEHADKALYASKAMGRNRVTHIYNLLGAQLEGRSPAA